MQRGHRLHDFDKGAKKPQPLSNPHQARSWIRRTGQYGQCTERQNMLIFVTDTVERFRWLR
jgi:hypothetical protein